MSNVDRTPFNLVPKDWAFDPEIGPFIQELLDVIWQLRLRTGGDIDRVASSITEVEAVSVSSSDSLYSHIGTVDNEQAFVAGYYVAGDGGGGTFYWDASSTAADDAAITILPTAHSGAGRWIRIYSRDSNVRWFGAKGDGVTNNDTALTTAVAHGEPIYVPPSTGNYITTNTNPNLVGKWVGDGQIEQSGVLTHAPNFIIADTEPSPRTTPSEAAVAVTAFTGDLSKAFQPVEVRVLGADTLGNPVSEPALQTGFYFCEELFPYYTHVVNQGGFNYAHDAPEGRSSMSAIRIVGTHTGGGGILPISTSTWASGNRGASEAASYGDGLATTTFLANPAASGANFSANAGADAVYLNPLEVNCVDNPSGSSPKDVAAIGFVANMIRDHDRTSVPLDCVWQGIRVQSVGDYPIDTVFTSSGPGGATTFIDATLTNLDANGELLLMKDGHRIYGNATFNSGTNRWKRATAGTDWMGYNSAVTGWQLVTDGTERLRVGTDNVYLPKTNPIGTDPSPVINVGDYIELPTGIGQDIKLINQWGEQPNPFPAAGLPRQGRTRVSAQRISSVHSGQGDCYNITSNGYVTKTSRSPDYVNTGDHNNVGMFNGQVSAGSDQVTLYGLGDVWLTDTQGTTTYDTVAMRGMVILLTANGLNDQSYDGNPAYHADRFCYMGRSQGTSDIDVIYTAIGKSKAAFDCSAAVLSDNSALNMAPGHRIYYNAAPATPLTGYVSPTPGAFWSSYNGLSVEHTGQQNMPGLPTFANEAAAASLATGDLYQTLTGELRIKL